MAYSSILDDLPAPPAPSEIDILNDRNPLDLTSNDISSIIAMHRQRRAAKADGTYVKPKPASAPSVDLSAVLSRSGLMEPPPPPAVTASNPLRRFSK